MPADPVQLKPPPPALACDAPDAHLVLAGDAGDDARCSLWWEGTPRLNGRRVGAIGHFSAVDAAGGARLLRAACARLAAQGCAVAVGPMDGSSWRSYRLVSERGDEPPFLLEPDTPAHWPACFAGAGFSVIARYCSSLQDDLHLRDARFEPIAQRAAAAGIRIRTFDRGRAEQDLCAIHALALEAFRDGFLYSPISRASFLAQYVRVLPLLREELVLLAELRGELVAFLFARPDALETARGAPPRTAILKTVAARRGRMFAGLAHLLAARAAANARALGYRRAVHALMHEGNGSRNWSARNGTVFRRYALLGRTL
jgi:hypothetical protein